MPRKKHVALPGETAETVLEAWDAHEDFMGSIGVRDEVIDRLTCQMGRLADLAREYLKHARVRANAGFKPERCAACDIPHPARGRSCTCPHHQLIELLNELGYPAAEVTLYG